MLRARDVTPPHDVAKAAKTLDGHELRLDPGSEDDPSVVCTREIAATCLDAVKCIRNFVNTVLTR